MSTSTLNFDTRDESEQIYAAKFNVLAVSHGIPIRYATDRAALDAGLHITIAKDKRTKGVTPNRVWFQFKGQSISSLSREDYEHAAAISQSVKIAHLRQWYKYGEPVYLAVYIEAADKFYAIDIHRLVNDRWGDRVFKDEPFLKTKGGVNESVTIHLPKDTSEVNEDFWSNLSKHRSMRVDLSAYQGKPLPHTHDHAGRLLRMMSPDLFEDVIGSLLFAYNFRANAIARDTSLVYPKAATQGDNVALLIGKMFDPFQYDHYLTREIGTNEDGFREDGQQFRVHGNCAVIIHSDVRSRPDPNGIRYLANYLRDNGINQILVFVNHYMLDAKWDEKEAFNCFPEFSEGLAGSEIDSWPLHLEDIGKPILLATNVYLDFREELEWYDEIIKAGIESGKYRVMTADEYNALLAAKDEESS